MMHMYAGHRSSNRPSKVCGPPSFAIETYLVLPRRIGIDRPDTSRHALTDAFVLDSLSAHTWRHLNRNLPNLYTRLARCLRSLRTAGSPARGLPCSCPSSWSFWSSVGTISQATAVPSLWA